MMHKCSYEHNIEHIRSNIGALNASFPKITFKSLSGARAYLVIKNNRIIYKCDIIALVMGIILSIIGKFFEHFSKA